MKQEKSEYKDTLWIELAYIVFKRNKEILEKGGYGWVISKVNEHYETFRKVENPLYDTEAETNTRIIRVDAGVEDDLPF
jgi:hypothetical protein